VEYPDRRIELLHGRESLPFKVFGEANPLEPAVDDKTLNPRMETILLQRSVPVPRKPPANHPWRQYRQKNAASAPAP
ncbi:MAG: hypothetical protein N2Z69_08660, partial [Methylophilaceae bacterium]|nr:hypothetical protein [Methylophilaceae bacterium]